MRQRSLIPLVSVLLLLAGCTKDSASLSPETPATPTPVDYRDAFCGTYTGTIHQAGYVGQSQLNSTTNDTLIVQKDPNAPDKLLFEGAFNAQMTLAHDSTVTGSNYASYEGLFSRSGGHMHYHATWDITSPNMFIHNDENVTK